MGELTRLRKKIDTTDDEILELLNRRSEIVIEVGTIKRAQKSRFYKPDGNARSLSGSPNATGVRSRTMRSRRSIGRYSLPRFHSRNR